MFKGLRKVFKAYDTRDKVLSFGALGVILLMILKLYVFPYGLFGFGTPNMYTEGLVSRTGIQNINPLFIDYNEADREVSRLVFSGLMKYDSEKQAIVDDMATLTINEDKTQYTFVMRDGLKWHDGKPVTADDVYFTFHDLVMNPAFPNEILKTNFAGVEIEELDTKTIRFTLEKPNIFFISNLTMGILPKHILGEVPAYEILMDDFNKTPIGSGPYMVKDAPEGFPDGRMQVTLERSPYYYDAPSEVEFVRFLVFPTMEQLVDGVNSLNGVVRITGDDILTFKNNPRFTLIPYELPQYTAVFMNMESAILKDHEKVRLALQKAVDKSVIIGDAGDKIAVDTPLMQLEQEEWVYQPSIEEAQGALKDSGYSYAEEDTEKVGIRYNDEGNALELNLIVRAYPSDSPQFEETIQMVSYLGDVWQSVGFNIQVEFLDLEDFKQRIMSRSYDLLLVGQSLGYNLDTYSYWHSTQATPGGQNLSNYKSFRVDSLIEDIRAVFNEEKRKRELEELAEQIKTDIPAIFLYRPVYYYAIDTKVKGISMDGVVFPSDRFSRIDEWTF